jgi:hypothetical protein
MRTLPSSPPSPSFEGEIAQLESEAQPARVRGSHQVNKYRKCHHPTQIKLQMRWQDAAHGRTLVWVHWA